MANEQNLKPLSPSKAREIGRKGGKKSGASRRKKKYIKEILEQLMQMDLTDTTLTNNMHKLGIEEADMTIQSGIVCALVQQALHRKFKSISTYPRSNAERIQKKMLLSHCKIYFLLTTFQVN